jgi:peroxiredoxin
MKASRIVIAAACCALVALAGANVGSRAHATAASAAADRTAAGAAKASSSRAAEAFAQVSADLKAKSQTMSPYDYVDYAEKALLGFLKTYPKGPDAAQAHYALGRIYASIGDSRSAADHFEAYLAEPGDKGSPGAVAQAKYVLGTSYVALERYDEAERVLREIAGPGAGTDRRVAEAARAELERIPGLRRLKVGEPAVEISGNSYQGNRIDLPRGYKGKVVLLDFWAAWCNPCRMEMPNVAKVYNEFHDKGFEVIGISLDREKSEFEGYIRDNDIQWPQLFDGKYWTSDYAKLYAVNSIPATFLIDRKGVIRFKNVRGEKLRAAVVQLLGEK